VVMAVPEELKKNRQALALLWQHSLNVAIREIEPWSPKAAAARFACEGQDRRASGGCCPARGTADGAPGSERGTGPDPQLSDGPSGPRT